MLGGEDRIELHTVGIDVGSATSHLAFCRLTAERAGGRYVVTARDLLYESRIALTPYSDPLTIDGTALEEFIRTEYVAAGVSPDAIDTGVVILTGMALRKENARTVGELFADETGRFVSLSAGDRLEAVLAAHGSGAVAASFDVGIVLNLDIGGGTTKFTLCDSGVVQGVAAIEIGARLVVRDASGAVVRLEEPGARIAKRCGLDLHLGATIDDDDVDRIVSEMVSVLSAALRGDWGDERLGDLLLTEPPEGWGRPAAIAVSGGVGEFFYGRESRDFGDLGRCLGRAFRDAVAESETTITPTTVGIRATVVGASQYTVQVSGSTIFVLHASALPLRNVPVIAPLLALDEDLLPDPSATSQAISDRLSLLELEETPGPIAVVMRWRGSVELERLDAICAGITSGLARHLERGTPLVLVWDDDVAGIVGRHLVVEFGVTSPLVSVDGIELREFDFVDIGEVIGGSGSVPVTIKSLTFPTNAASSGSPPGPEPGRAGI